MQCSGGKVLAQCLLGICSLCVPSRVVLRELSGTSYAAQKKQTKQQLDKSASRRKQRVVDDNIQSRSFSVFDRAQKSERSGLGWGGGAGLRGLASPICGLDQQNLFLCGFFVPPLECHDSGSFPDMTSATWTLLRWGEYQTRCTRGAHAVRIPGGVAWTVSATLEATCCWSLCFCPKLYLTLQQGSVATCKIGIGVQ